MFSGGGFGEVVWVMEEKVNEGLRWDGGRV